MKISLIYFTKTGEETCKKIQDALTRAGHRCAGSDGRRLPEGLSKWTQQAFSDSEALVFVSAAGIAVRAIAPFVKSKAEDPAVIVTDERGIHVISLLSGHLGGANRLTCQIAEALNAHPVITTATDINQRFAVDQWAQDQGLAISDMKAAKEVSAALLRKESVALISRYPVEGPLPEGLVLPGENSRQKANEEDGKSRNSGSDADSNTERDSGPGSGERASVCIAVCPEKPDLPGYSTVLWLVPQILFLGIGCRKGTSEAQILQAVSEALKSQGYSPLMIRKASSIELKKDEAGLLSFVKNRKIPFEVYTAEELKRAEIPGGFSSSPFVSSITGVDNVCERAAVVSALMEGTGRARLVLRKFAMDGVTVAAAVCDEVSLKMAPNY